MRAVEEAGDVAASSVPAPYSPPRAARVAAPGISPGVASALPMAAAVARPARRGNKRNAATSEGPRVPDIRPVGSHATARQCDRPWGL